VKLGDGGDVDVNLNDDLFIEGSSSRVGIGTIAPQQELHVAGDVIINETLNMDSGKITNVANGTDAQDAVTYSQLMNVNATAGASETDPQWRLNYTNMQAFDCPPDYHLIGYYPNGTPQCYPETDPKWTGNVSLFNASWLNTTNLSYMTGVNFTIQNTSMRNYVDSQNFGTGSITGAGTTGYITRWNGTTSLNNSVMYEKGSNVGIGTIDPTYTLDVVGNIGLSEYLYHNDDTDTYFRFELDRLRAYIGAENLLDLYEGTQDYVKLGDGGDVDVNLNDDLFIEGSSSRVGIGTIAPQQELHVAGDILANGTITADGAQMNGNVNLSANSNITMNGGNKISSNVTCIKIQGPTSVLEVC